MGLKMKDHLKFVFELIQPGSKDKVSSSGVKKDEKNKIIKSN